MPRYGPGTSGTGPPPRKRRPRQRGVSPEDRPYSRAAPPSSPKPKPRYSVPTAQPARKRSPQEERRGRAREREQTRRAAERITSRGRRTAALFTAAGVGAKPKSVSGNLLRALGTFETGITAPGRGARWVLERDPTGLVNPKTQAEFLVHPGRMLKGTRQAARSYMKRPTLGGAATTALATAPMAVIGAPRGTAPRARAKPRAPEPEQLALPGHGKERVVERPRTRAEAQKRLDQIDAANAKIVEGMREEHPRAQAEQLRRNKNAGLISRLERTGKRRAGTAKALRAGKQRTVREEELAAAQRRLDEWLGANPKHPVARAYNERVAEAERLREQLNAPDIFEERKPADFGTVRETVTVPTARLAPTRLPSVRKKFAQAVRERKPELVREYERRFGKIVSTDEARELSPEYAASPEARGRHAAAVHEPASALAKHVYAAKLARPVEGNGHVLIMGGGTGAGKSFALRGQIDGAEIVYDTNLNSVKSGAAKIEQALRSGRHVDVAYVYREPLEALEGAFHRAERTTGAGAGRTVPIGEHVRTTVGANEAIRELAKRYANNPRVTIRAYENRTGEPLRRLELAQVPKLRHNQVDEVVRQRLEQARARGEISERTYQGFAQAGIEPNLRRARAERPPAGVGETAQLSGQPPAPPRPPVAKGGPEPLKPPEQLVRESLGPARARRAAQEGLYREERGRRVARASAASEAAGGGLEGYRAAGAQLRGELPKVQFQHLREGRLSQDGLDQIFRTVELHPELGFYEKRHAQRALFHAFEHGRTPQKSQIELLRRVFGQDAATEIARISKLRRTGQLTLEALNVPRSLMASLDVSAPFRQGLVMGARHPLIFAREFGPMFKALGSERAYQAILDDIHSRPNFDLYEQAGVKFTELGRLDLREEQFMSNLAETVTGGKRYSFVRASGRAYTGFLDKLRADSFDHLLEVARKEGRNVEDQKFLRGLARFVNGATGRGSLGPAESWAPALNSIFFSPRLIASRIDMLTMYLNPNVDPFARKQALIAMLRLAGAAGLVLELANLSGAVKVNLDPRNADFAKMRIGDTRVDVLGGFQQYLRVVSQIASGKVISSTTGKTMTLGRGFGKLSRWDIAERFAVGKFSPPASFVHDLLKGTQFDGQPFDVKKAVVARIVPLVAQDAADLYKHTHDLPLAAAGYSVAAFGIGMQTYSGKDRGVNAVKKHHDDYGAKILEGVRKTGLAGKNEPLRAPVKRALEIRAERFEYREKLGADDTRSNFIADVKFIYEHKLPRRGGSAPTKAQLDKAIRWAKSEKREALVSDELRHLYNWYFRDAYGNALTDVKKKLKKKGYDLPTLH